MPDFIPRDKLTSLEGRNAVVTGSATGIGEAIALRLAEAGAAVLIADIDEKAAAVTAVNFIEKGFCARSTGCDVSNEDSVRNMIGYAADCLGGVDILVNNAGIYPRKALEETTAADFEKVLGINLTGTFLCSRYAAEVMKKAGRPGCIINMASIEALHPASTGMHAYDSSKAGVVMLTKSLARELGRYDIRVNVIAPGGIVTQAVHTSVSPENATTESPAAARKELKAFMSRIVLGCMGKPDDIARTALFLASDMSAYITGQLIVVDGGYLIS
jgi:NAD(P)-dependent dehydrogenase (short-subunit alcohol dehydrogenase family)